MHDSVLPALPQEWRSLIIQHWLNLVESEINSLDDRDQNRLRTGDFAS